jgi:hypothetical protein
MHTRRKAAQAAKRGSIPDLIAFSTPIQGKALRNGDAFAI